MGLTELIEWARSYRMSPEEQREQAISFSWANVVLDGQEVTRKDIEEAMDGRKQE